MKIIGWILLYGLVAGLEIPGFFKEGKKKQIIIYSVILGLSLTLILLAAMNIGLPVAD